MGDVDTFKGLLLPSMTRSIFLNPDSLNISQPRIISYIPLEESST